MGIKSSFSPYFAYYIYKKTQKWADNPEKTQNKIFHQLINKAKNTVFGKKHGFADIKSYNDFVRQVPVGDYELLKPYIEKTKKGEKNQLWPHLPVYFAKTSGTTSGTKYIPITKDSINSHFASARNALMHYVYHTGKTEWLDKNYIFLSGSPTLIKENNILIGRLSGIANHHVPSYLRTNQLPSYTTNCLEDWESKLDAIVDETLQANMSLISGIPPWVQMYFDKIVLKEKKLIKDVFPSFDVFVHGGVNFKPYADKLYQTIGKKIDTIETYPASEGFIAYQDLPASYEEATLLLLLDNGIFYEFIKADEYYNAQPKRYTIENIELNINYVLIINSNAGLWGYNIGDTIKFVSKNPFRIVVTGRIKHFISAFGEHVIADEVDKALFKTMQEFPETMVIEYTVAPLVTPKSGLPRHEWYIAFETPPNDLASFQKRLNLHLQNLNTYYDDLLKGKVLEELKVIPLKATVFIQYMKSIGKLGGQNKVSRLSNDRKIVEALANFNQ